METGSHSNPQGMPPAMTAGSQPRWPLRVNDILVFAVIAVTACFVVQLIRLAFFKSYSIDEFTYAHASWLIAHGRLPYRDFFCHHFPFHLYLMALPFLILGDDPNNILYLRLLTLPFVGLIALTTWYINRRQDRYWALATPLLLCSALPFAAYATENRPDPIAMALCLSATALLSASWPRARLRGILAGLLVGLAIWSSEKVLCYGAVFAAAFALDVFYNWRRKRGCLLANPWTFLLGTALVLAVVFSHLVLTHSWSPWLLWSVRFTRVYQDFYPGFSRTTYVVENYSTLGWLAVFALVGLTETIVRLVQLGGDGWRHPDGIVAGMVPTTLASYALQRAPYPYSLVPVIAVLSIFSARGLASTVRFFVQSERLSRPIRILFLSAVSLFLAGQLFVIYGKFDQRLAVSNAYQREVLSAINELTGPDDLIYDNSGSFVSRPHLSFYYFRNAFMRQAMRKDLIEDEPASIMNQRCTVFLCDLRFKSLPASLKRFIVDNSVPFNDDLRFWGRRYEVGAEHTLNAFFYAPRDGKYFVEPALVLDQGTLLVDGTRVNGAVFELRKGTRNIHYEGKGGEFFLVWLPRNGRPFVPLRQVTPHFSILL